MAASMNCRKSFVLFTKEARHKFKRCCCQSSTLTNAEVKRKRNEMFENEKKRQLQAISRLEKIQVDVKGPPEDCTLVMNKSVSTPFNCAMHIQELLMNRSSLALVNGAPWDMHRPLTNDCSLEFLHFQDEDPRQVNNAFWRSCTLILGSVLETAFQDKYYIELCSFPRGDVRSGSFVYDADLKLPGWSPTAAELNCLSRIGYKLKYKDYKFERLEVDGSLALKIFEDNKFKSEQIPQMVTKSESGSTLTVYRVGEFIDITRGPCMSNTSQLGRFSVTAAHEIESDDYGKLHRVQGLALPTQTMMHYWSYDILCRRAAKFNPASLPGLKQSTQQQLIDYR